MKPTNEPNTTRCERMPLTRHKPRTECSFDDVLSAYAKFLKWYVNTMFHQWTKDGVKYIRTKDKRTNHFYILSFFRDKIIYLTSTCFKVNCYCSTCPQSEVIISIYTPSQRQGTEYPTNPELFHNQNREEKRERLRKRTKIFSGSRKSVSLKNVITIC